MEFEELTYSEDTLNLMKMDSFPRFYSDFMSHRLNEAEKVARANSRVSSPNSRYSSTPLHEAVKIKDEAFVRMLLAHQANINGRNYLNETPLHCAVARRSIPMVKLLIDQGADINAVDDLGKTPLHFATTDVIRNRMEIVTLLLKKGANINICDRELKTVLQLAVMQCDLSMVKEILVYHPDVENEANRRSLHATFWEPRTTYSEVVLDLLFDYGFEFLPVDATDADFLHNVVRHGRIDLIEKLLSFGADVNTVDGSEKSPTLLHTAAGYKKFKIIELLLSHGANVNARDNDQKLAITYSVELDDERTMKRLLNEMAPYSQELITELFHVAVKYLSVRIVKCFLQHENIDVNARDASGRTLVQSMVSGSSWNLTYPNEFGELINNFAYFVNILRLLRFRGINVDARGKNGRTALHTAMMKNGGDNYKNVIRVLVDSGADIDVKDYDEATPLHLASYVGNATAVSALLHSGASVDEQDKLGRTALHIAANYGRAEVIRRLVFNGANIDLICKVSMFTALDYANKPTCCVDKNPRDVLYMDEEKISPIVMDYHYSIATFLEQEVLVTKALTIPVSSKDLRDTVLKERTTLSSLMERCSGEILKMMKITVGKKNVTLYEVAAGGCTNRLATYLKDETFVKALTKLMLNSEFYRGLLSRRLRQGKERIGLLSLGLTPLRTLSGCGLPDDCAFEIFDYLTNQDLKNLRKVYPCSKEESFYELCE